MAETAESIAQDVRNNQDEILMNLLVKNQTLVGFLFSVFGFLARRTDFYMIRDELNPQSAGFPPGIAEELVMRVLRKCNPLTNELRTENVPENCHELIDDNSFDCVPPFAQEIEIEATEELFSNDVIESEIGERSDTTGVKVTNGKEEVTLKSLTIDDKSNKLERSTDTPVDDVVACSNTSSLSTESSNCDKDTSVSSDINYYGKHSESYNGAIRDKYSWSQTINELDVTVELPLTIKSSKQLKVAIASESVTIECLDDLNVWITLLNDTFTKKTKQAETIWTMSGGKLRLHLEKQSEGWWSSLLDSEEKIDTSKIDCSRPISEFPEQDIAKVREIHWNQMQKMAGKPTSGEIQKQEILKKAWNLPGSPFMNTPYDPNVFH